MSRRLLTKGVLRFTSEDGKEREVAVELYSDETYKLSEPTRKAAGQKRAGLFQPATQLPTAVAHEALANVIRRRLEGRGT